MKTPKNENYAAVVVEIKTLVPLEKCDNVQAAIIMGNQVVVSKDVKVGDIGLYFPLETQLSNVYLTVNNLYRKSELNADPKQKGYFEENGRIRCVKFRGHKSEGLFMPIESVSPFQPIGELIKLGDCFDELGGSEICRKYVIKTSKTPGLPGTGKKGKGRVARESKLIDNQFRFHQDTSMLYKNLHMISPDNLISITYKMHGTSGISSYILCKKPLKWYEKALKWYGLNIVDTNYDYIYASRKVIKNSDLNPNAEHFYGEDIWGIAHEELKEHLQKGMTFYYEIVGFLPGGGNIQANYDYGCLPTHHAIYIYRITHTNVDGKVFEFSAKQVQDFCKKNGLNAVPELYYGEAANVATDTWWDYLSLSSKDTDFGDWFLEHIKSQFNEKDCHMCTNKVPEEGCVIRVEELDFKSYKQKSNRFYELETKLLDKGESNIEDDN